MKEYYCGCSIKLLITFNLDVSGPYQIFCPLCGCSIMITDFPYQIKEIKILK